MTCCFVCGCEKAKWPIPSKPSACRQPFFPFLDFHKPQANTQRVETDGQYIVCNVCYAFLIQQWNSYEENGTPLSNRLYWVKHNRDAERSCFDDSFYDKNEEDSQSICNSFSLEDGSNAASFQDSSSSESDSEPSVLLPIEQANNLEEEGSNREREKQSDPKSIEDSHCFVCRQPTAAASLKPVHTKPQLRKETPFYPTLASCNADAAIGEIDLQGRFLACIECNEKLLFQWHLYMQRGIPVSDRKYVLDESFDWDKKSTCFVCGGDDESSMSELTCLKVHANEPYFPFLKNLREPPGAEPICSKGIIKCCSKCTSKILSQWFDYTEAKVPLYDQVYFISSKTDALPEKIHAPVSDEKDLVCLICQRNELRKYMKEVYSNPYANMDLSFLEKIPKVSQSYFAKTLGQALVCIACYKSLVYQWKRFDSNDVPLDQREYKLQRYQGRDEKTVCEICTTPVERQEVCDTHILPEKNDDKRPFFPSLARFFSEKTERKLNIQSCCFCHQNLILQWHHYEKDCKAGNDRWKRSYKPHHFVCFLCSSATHRSNICLVHKHSCSPMKNLMQHQSPLLAVDVRGFVAVCLHCKEILDAGETEIASKSLKVKKIDEGQIKQEIIDTAVETGKRENDNLSDKSATIRRSPTFTSENKEVFGMKVTATVPPLPSLLQRHPEEGSSMQNQPSAGRNDDEGSFAAALRKLAQQAIVPVARRPGPRECHPTSPSPFKPASAVREQSPTRNTSNGRQSHSPFYSRNSLRPSSISASSSVASILPSTSAFDKEKPDVHSKPSFGGQASANDIGSRRLSRSIIPGVFARHEPNENVYRQNRDEGNVHHGDKGPMREPSDQGSKPHSASGLVTGPSNGQLSILGAKDRGSNIGLVHPQPVRKLPDEDAHKSGLINSMRCNPLESPASLFRPPSPSDGLSRYQLMHGLHQHNSQGACPVHGHESGHHHANPRDHAGRPGRLPFEGISPRSGPLSEYRGMHSHHQRIRDEMYGINRLPAERREALPNHMLEEDLRRRGYDWPWPVQHPLYENEQFRRHLLNGYRGGEHTYKDMMHGPPYISPHLYYPPEYPPIDPYGHPSLPHADVYPNRYGSAQLSPRLYDYYRRERPMSERATDRNDARRQDSASLKLNQGERERRISENVVNEGRVLDERHSRRTDISDYFSFSRERVAQLPGGKDDRKERNSLENIIDAIGKKSTVDSEEPRRKMRIMEKLELIAKPYNERETSIDDVVVKKEPDTPMLSCCDAESTQHEIKDNLLSEDADDVDMELAPEDIEKKADFMSSIGLISHGKRRVLEEDYERRRWERKVAKMRGKPRKRRRREQTDESDGRPCSEIDFYNGPMTRHKQQLLQEQEMLLEQVQKNHLERNNSKDTSSLKAFSSASSSPINSSVASTTPNSINENMFQTAPLEKRVDSENLFSAKTQSFKPYKDRQSRKEFVNIGTTYQKCDDSLSKGSEEFDCYTFGLPQVHIPGIKDEWRGIDGTARLFVDYEQGRDVKESSMRESSDKLRFETEKLSQQRQQYQKEILALREKRNHVTEKLERHEDVARSLFTALRKISST